MTWFEILCILFPFSSIEKNVSFPKFPSKREKKNKSALPWIRSATRTTLGSNLEIRLQIGKMFEFSGESIPTMLWVNFEFISNVEGDYGNFCRKDEALCGHENVERLMEDIEMCKVRFGILPVFPSAKIAHFRRNKALFGKASTSSATSRKARGKICCAFLGRKIVTRNARKLWKIWKVASWFCSRRRMRFFSFGRCRWRRSTRSRSSSRRRAMTLVTMDFFAIFLHASRQEVQNRTV